MQYLGKHKRRLALISTEVPEDLSINVKIVNENDQDAGTIVYSEGNQALAVIRLEHQNGALKIEHPIQINHIWHEVETEE